MKLANRTFKKYFDKQHGRCYYCGYDLRLVKIEIDHIKPFSKSKDGTNKNLCLSCSLCNRMKSNLELYEFKQILSNKYPDRLIRGDFYFEFIRI